MRSGMPVAESEGTREALTRVLAIESRNALARVELAASELSRFELSPSIGDRITTIHDAVSQIDGLLAKIDLLASPRQISSRPAVEIGSVWRRIRKRLDPTLAARGIRLEEMDGREIETDVFVEIPELALEAILCSLLRVAIASVGRNERLGFEVVRGEEAVLIALIAMTPIDDADDADDAENRPLDRVGRIELEVQLAEWGGLLDNRPASVPGGLGIWLPLGSLDG